MRKLISWSVIGFLLYSLFMYLYLFYMSDTSIPAELKGTSVDPATFMNARELMLSEEYSKIRNVLFFIGIPYEWLAFILVLAFGFSRRFSYWSQEISKKMIVQTSIYAFWLSLILLVLSFPLDLIKYQVSKNYNITTQSFQGWMKDIFIDFWISYLMLAVTVAILYWLIRKYQKRWWLYAWVLSVPFTLFLTFIQPVVIDPLYNDFYPLQDKELEAKILNLANEANIPAEHVYEVNMSEKTNSMNAYVTGIGSNSRIVLWDTTLEKLGDNEILFIMAHEMGHYVKKHVYGSILLALGLSLVGLWIIKHLAQWVIRKWGQTLQLSSLNDVASLPLLLLLVSLMTFIISPFTNVVSRYHELQSDTYAIELTGDQQAAVKTFQELTKSGLSQVNPPYLVKLFRYSHPTILERIQFIEEYKKSE
ncbi:M48 family metallopeptidase [Bacillus sp. CGMCC 1.16541]|uniref:M48 family metallopeptidase n=1 Tax=Bacillus sp. CGMCC 1.16541 TaxID=2185143 RepID=UPI000D731FDA|nr:M48 family metallopeptidase [Bacillus sp. CGMCC 1.16541]